MHEERIELVNGIKPRKKSDVLLYGAKIGEHDSPLDFVTVAEAMFPARYPAADKGIELSPRARLSIIRRRVLADGGQSPCDLFEQGEGAQGKREPVFRVRPVQCRW